MEREKMCKNNVNRIVVNGMDGNVYTIRPDGTDGRMLTCDASTNKKYRQPTWSPLADRIAFSSMSPTEGSELITCDQYGEKITSAKSPDPAFYIYWAPDDTRLLFMCNVWLERRTFGVFLVDVGKGGSEVHLMQTGFPFFFSWFEHEGSPYIVAHISRERIEILNVELRQKEECQKESVQRFFTFENQSVDGINQISRFSTPIWLSKTNQVIFATGGAGGRAESSIIRASLTEKTELIISKCLTKSPLRFTVSPDERILAFAPSEGGLHVFKLGETGRVSTVSANVMTAFFWSPNSRYLLWCYLDINMRCFYWAAHDFERETAYRLSSFVPSQDLMNNYFPFFCQYTRSMNIFSPDSKHFVYSHHDGMIYVHSINEGSVPITVGEGTYAAWSPL